MVGESFGTVFKDPDGFGVMVLHVVGFTKPVHGIGKQWAVGEKGYELFELILGCRGVLVLEQGAQGSGIHVSRI